MTNQMLLKTLKSCLHWIEKIVGKEENAGCFFSHNVFKSLFPPVRQTSPLCGKGLMTTHTHMTARLGQCIEYQNIFLFSLLGKAGLKNK